jgi:hypothetical protein
LKELDVKRIPTCMGIDEDNKLYLADRSESAAEFVNSLIRLYRESESVRDEAEKFEKKKPKLDRSVVLEKLIKKTKEEKADIEIKVKAYLADHPWVVYSVATDQPPSSSELTKLKDRMSWSKYRIRTDCETIQKIVLEEAEHFDVKEYEMKNNIPVEKRYEKRKR